MKDTIIQIEEGDVVELVKDLAYHGAQDGSALVKNSKQGCDIAVYKSLEGVPMGFVEGASFVATLATLHAIQNTLSEITISWPTTIMYGNEELAHVSATAGFQGGLFAVISVTFNHEIGDELIEDIVTRITDELGAWREGVEEKKILAGPLSQCLDEYFDYVPLLSHEVLVQNHEGKLIFTGTFAGLDVWGHAIVVDKNNTEKNFAPDEGILLNPDKQ